jgi:hypothetical protein
LKVKLDPNPDLPLILISVDDKVLPASLVDLSSPDLAYMDDTGSINVVAE